jgi:23S rRNA pseudouridine2605 synthase
MVKEIDIPGERIAKYLARAGICSRREAEDLIVQGRVRVNGEIIDSPATFVSDADDIRVDSGKKIKKEIPRLFLFHKPVGLLTATKDPRGRPTIFDVMPRTMPRVVSVGRLDMNTEGLILLTNDGEIKRYLELPSTGWVRSYRARVHGTVNVDRLDKLKKGMVVKSVKYGPVIAKLEKAQQSANSWVQLSLTEGKNREVRNLMKAIHLDVNRLIRTSYGPFQLGKLPRGAIIEVKTKALREQLPKALVDKIFGVGEK